MKHFLFRKFFFATLGGTVLSAFVGIFMAYHGFGVWALVAQQMINNCVDTLILWVMVKWKPTFCFSFKRLKSLFSYCWKLLVSGVLDNSFESARQLLIGRVYTSTDLAYYAKGKLLPELIHSNLTVSVDSVMFPTLAEKQDDKNE